MISGFGFCEARIVKGAWPKVTGQIRFEFSAEHSMPRIGNGCEVRHAHSYVVQFGWTHEIQPRYGYTHEFRKQHSDFAEIVQRVSGKYLNDVLPMQPSAEVLALWLLSQADPAYCDHVTVTTYDTYTVRVDRCMQRSEWTEFLAGRADDPFSLRQASTLK